VEVGEVGVAEYLDVVYGLQLRKVKINTAFPKCFARMFHKTYPTKPLFYEC
jgi:hypothetical protein